MSLIKKSDENIPKGEPMILYWARAVRCKIPEPGPFSFVFGPFQKPLFDPE